VGVVAELDKAAGRKSNLYTSLLNLLRCDKS
jgi:hypothetical protein